ncbi:CDC25-like phosphatase [Lachnellula hyalina]|uniref:CDC25-like phosphatase n=1 Tax=Lachnellula hyalina TaxID=1316788 RepID=A0A8H8QX74_9HELO|nr:CDC25-like phosphatase [Lachnellula hyalina]TVY24497.1 CDC25-like phosphatase [Lachnellula hyalina]
MSNHTIATLPRLTATNLSQIILTESTSSSNLDASTPPSKIAIVDVRDDDHIGGHIKHSLHVPSRTLDIKTPELVRKLASKEAVVFHCALSQQRGPSAALRYIRERERLMGKGSVSTGHASGVGEMLKKNAEDKAEGEKDGEWEDVDEVKEQKVYVLDQGFVGWQQEYGEDTRLTEGYRKELWKDGYWM